MQRTKATLRVALAVVMIAAGVSHFARPDLFLPIVPDYLPAPLALVLISGFFEIAGGVGLLVRRVRRAAAYGLVLLYVAVFPANLYAAMHQIPALGVQMSPLALWLRLPLQLVFIAWALFSTSEARRA